MLGYGELSFNMRWLHMANIKTMHVLAEIISNDIKMIEFFANKYKKTG